MPAPTHDDPQPLLEHVAWVRALARRLARAAHAGDDVSPTALVAALAQPSGGGAARPARADDSHQAPVGGLEQPSGGGAPGRRWLATVARNFFRQRLRAASR